VRRWQGRIDETCQDLIDIHDFMWSTIFFQFLIIVAVRAASTKERKSETASRSSDLIPRDKLDKSLPNRIKYTK
jgi:hypothetical protein